MLMIGIYLVLMTYILILNSFHFRALDIILYGIFTLCIVLVALVIFIPILRAPEMIVFIYTAGFIVHNQRSSRVVRWESVERVEQSKANSRCVISLTDASTIILSKYLDNLMQLAAEIELKAQFARACGHYGDLEQQFERSQNELAERQQVAKTLYQVQRSYLATHDPNEAVRLGEEYRLAEALGTYRSGFRSLFQFATLKRSGLILFLAAVLINDPQRGVQPFWPTGCLVTVALFSIFFILPRIASRNVRLHIYTDGFIYVTDAVNIIRWESIEKVVYSTALFTDFCTFHLKTGEKLILSPSLERQNTIKQMLDPKIEKKEMYPLKKD
jgi:hypothetical protein